MMNNIITRTLVTIVSAAVVATSVAPVAMPATVAYAATTEAHAMYYVSGDVTTCAYYDTDNKEQENRRFTYWNSNAAFTQGGTITNSLKSKTTPCWSPDGSYLIYQEQDNSAVMRKFPEQTTTKVANVTSVSLDSNNLFASATVNGATVNSTNALLALANGSSGTNDSSGNSNGSSSSNNNSTMPSLNSYVTLTDYTGTHDGKAHSIKAECKVTGAAITYSTDNKTFSATNPSFTNVGNYTVYVKITAVGYQEFNGSAKVTINAAPTMPSLNSYVTLTDYTGTYDGKAHSVSAKCSVTGASITYSADNKTFSATNPSYTKVGNYTVYVKVTAVGYQEFNGSAKVTINAETTNGSSSGNNGGDTTYNQNGNNSNYYNGDTTINNYYDQTPSSSSSTSTKTKWTVKNNSKHTSATLYKSGKKVGVLKVSGRKLIYKGKTIKLLSKTQYNVGVRFKNVGFTKNGSKIVAKLNTGKKYTSKRTSPTKFSTTTKAMSFASTGWVTLK